MQLFRPIETTACHVLDPWGQQMPPGLTHPGNQTGRSPSPRHQPHVHNGSVHLCQRPGIDAVPACILVRATAGRRLPLPWCHISVRHGVHDARVSVAAALALLRARSRLPAACP